MRHFPSSGIVPGVERGPEQCKVVLVAPPVWEVKTPPLTVTIVGAYAAAKGYDVRIIDLNIRLYHELASIDPANIRLWHLSHLSNWYEEDEYMERLQDLLQPFMERCAEEILAHNPCVVGITLNGIRPALHLAREIRKRDPNVWLVAGGQYAQPLIWGEMVLFSGLFQYVVVGEGEVTFHEILERRRKGLEPLSVDGTLVQNEKEGYRIAKPRELIRDLDSLPFPLYDDIDPEMYVVEYEPPPFVPSKAFSILSSRGCINRCDFCIQHVIWRDRIRLRSPENVLDEVEWLVRKFGVEELNFNDLLVNPSHKRLDALCKAFIRRGLDVVWNGDLTVDPRIDQGLANRMYEAGCRNATFGIESASTKVLGAMGKRYDAFQAGQVLERMNRAGMRAWCSIVVGHPAEEEEDFLETMDFLCKNRELIAGPPGLSLCVMFRGSRLWSLRESYGMAMPRDDAAGWHKRDATNDYSVRSLRARLMDDLAYGLYHKEAWLANKPKVEEGAGGSFGLDRLSPAMLLAEAAGARDPGVSAAALKLLASKKRRHMMGRLKLSAYRHLLAHALSRPGNLAGLTPPQLFTLAVELPGTAVARRPVVNALLGMGKRELAYRLARDCKPVQDPGVKELLDLSRP